MNPQMQKRISVGWNGRAESLPVLAEHHQAIAEVYFAPPGLPSGRNNSATRAPQYAEHLTALLGELAALGIRSNLLLNGLCSGPETGSRAWARRAVATVARYQELGVSDVSCVSITDLLLLRHEFPQLTLHVSVNMFIDSVEKAAQLRHVCDVITLDRSLNYDLQGIAAIRQAVPQRLKLLVNEGCLSGCVHRVQHFNALAHNRNLQTAYCKFLFARSPALILQTPFIRPEDLPPYFSRVDYFKLATRDVRTAAQLDRLLRAYGDCRYAGNLFDLVSSDGIAAVAALGIPLYLPNAEVPAAHFDRRVAERGRWLPDDPIRPEMVFRKRSDSPAVPPPARRELPRDEASS